MTWQNETCDFCNHRVDPIGGDLAQILPDGRFWCGVCEPGLIARFEHASDTQLETARLILQGDLAANPIDWNAQNVTLEQKQAHLMKVDKSDLLDNVNWEIKRRRNRGG